MTKKKRSSIQAGLRNLKPVGGNPGPMYKGARSGPAEVATVRERLPEAAKKLNVGLLRFAIECVRAGTSHGAYQNLYKKATYESAVRRGWELMRGIERRLGGEVATNEFFYELSGMTLMNFTTRIEDAMGATLQKDFILPKSGQIISTPPVPDHPTRLAAVALGMKLTGIGAPEAAGQVLTVNVIQYSKPTDLPWPGGGRGSLPVATVASTPALPSPTKTIVYDPASVSTGNRHD